MELLINNLRQFGLSIPRRIPQTKKYGPSKRPFGMTGALMCDLVVLAYTSFIM